MDPVVLLIIAGLVAWVLIDLSRNRLSKCPRCNGSGRLESTFFPGRYRPCPRCDRRGEIRHKFGGGDD